MNTALSLILRDARTDKGLKQEDVAKVIGVKKNTISNYETGKSKPDIETFVKMCEIYGVAYTELLEVAYPLNKIDFAVTIPEQNHIKKYRVLDEHGKEAVDGLLNVEHDRIIRLEQERLERERREKEKTINLPAASDDAEPQNAEMKVYSQPAAAGIGNYLTDDDDYALLTFPVDEIPPRADFGIRISGDSMEPEISDGDIVWVEAMHEIKSGEIGVFILNGDSLCKELHLKGRVAELISLNTNYKPIKICEDDNLRTVGKVLL